MKIIYANPFHQAFVNDFKPSRTQECTKYYTEYQNALKTQNISHERHILNTEFISPKQKISLSENNFPYDLPKAFSHFLIWGDKMTDAQAKQFAFLSFDLVDVVMIFKNDKKDQSVKNLTHYHVIVDETDLRMNIF